MPRKIFPKFMQYYILSNQLKKILYIGKFSKYFTRDQALTNCLIIWMLLDHLGEFGKIRLLPGENTRCRKGASMGI